MVQKWFFEGKLNQTFFQFKDWCLAFPLPLRGHITACNFVAILAAKIIKPVPIKVSTNTTMRAPDRRCWHDLNKVSIIGNPDFKEGVDVVSTSPSENPMCKHSFIVSLSKVFLSYNLTWKFLVHFHCVRIPSDLPKYGLHHQ